MGYTPGVPGVPPEGPVAAIPRDGEGGEEKFKLMMTSMNELKKSKTQERILSLD